MAPAQSISLRNKDTGCRATQTTPRYDLILDDEPVCMDIEFQRYCPQNDNPKVKWMHRIGRISLVNTRGDVVLDVYARYPYVEGISKMYGKRFVSTSMPNHSAKDED